MSLLPTKVSKAAFPVKQSGSSSCGPVGSNARPNTPEAQLPSPAPERSKEEERRARIQSSGFSLPNAATVEYSSSCRGDPNHKIILLLLCNCSFAPAMDHSVSICTFRWSSATPVNGHRTTRLRMRTLAPQQLALLKLLRLPSRVCC